MKKLTSFLAGAVTSALLISLPVSTLAAAGKLTLEVEPIQIQVNGEAFRPTDAQGNAVMVFAYNGTTYAPLRALAEAYGLEVGYDSEKHVATVNQPSAGQWEVTEKPVTHYGNERIYTVTYAGPLTLSEFKDWWNGLGEAAQKAAAEQEVRKIQAVTPEADITAYFYYGDYSLGTVVARGDYCGCDFTAAKAWIK